MLMILDGIEPLQDIPLVNGGRLRDQGLAEFIKRLAQAATRTRGLNPEPRSRRRAAA